MQCRPSVNHGGAATPKALTINTLSKSDQAIIQPGGNAWYKKTYMDIGVAHLMAMFTDLSFDISLLRISTTEQSAVAIVSYRLGGLHMGKPATTFGLGAINLIKKNDQWLIQHIHNSDMQVY
ncbi:nuclear transport factor 2 family protein [Oceanicoccus sagamiensis]|uniref:SnoaL-like domain-containing protein n=1 Tax=Oceanicoccus sagamiensis TaxID=716816 RepID=A0A1X9NK99_9GAMM|nr:nuclear transport factor 2 family protein [Oceanicoccus sagamiensis]ARN74383.1 hypothetical protein BST96_09765 [Oceanicoccus sagamiensis]